MKLRKSAVVSFFAPEKISWSESEFAEVAQFSHRYLLTLRYYIVNILLHFNVQLALRIKNFYS